MRRLSIVVFVGLLSLATDSSLAQDRKVQDISLPGLRKAMAEALKIHAGREAMKPLIAGKQAKPSSFATPRDSR